MLMIFAKHFCPTDTVSCSPAGLSSANGLVLHDFSSKGKIDKETQAINLFSKER